MTGPSITDLARDDDIFHPDYIGDPFLIWPDLRTHCPIATPIDGMEARVAIEEWLRQIPEYRVADGAGVTWAGGQVRGPRSVPVVFPG